MIIGHDWGAAAAYNTAAHEPERWRRVVTAAVPPLASMADGFFTYDQLRRSWYVFFFQTPFAEMVVARDDYAFIDRLWADWSPGYDGSWDAAQVKRALATPESLGAAIGCYRAMFAGPPEEPNAAAAQAAGAGIVAPAHSLSPWRRRRMHGYRCDRTGDRFPRARIGNARHRRCRPLLPRRAS